MDFELRKQCAAVKAEVIFLASEMKRIASMVEKFDTHPFSKCAQIADHLGEVEESLRSISKRVMAVDDALGELG